MNTLGLEAYLCGVVPHEMPYDWPAEALKAQAVVARSYALAVRKDRRPFDLYADTRSQVYGGIAAETPTARAAVDGDGRPGRALRGQGRDTYFFSTSGGRTANVARRLAARSRAVPRLGRRPVRHALAAPHAGARSRSRREAARERWSCPGGCSTCARTQPVAAAPRASRVGDRGEASCAAATSARARPALDLVPRRRARARAAAGPVVVRRRVTLTGMARGVGAVMLEQRVGAGVWQRGGARARADGSSRSPSSRRADGVPARGRRVAPPPYDGCGLAARPPRSDGADRARAAASARCSPGAPAVISAGGRAGA